jgi:hypothetical protein
MLKLAHREPRPVLALAMPLHAAVYCADCESLFDIRSRRSCPACASETIVPVGSLISRRSPLRRPSEAS